MEENIQIDAPEIKASPRTQKGKGAARKIRRQGLIPGVFYGARHQPVALTLSPEELKHALNTPKLLNTILKLKSEDPELNGRLAMVREIQKHPISRKFIHVDLMEVYPDLPVRVEVPVEVKGHAKGVDLGGTLEVHLRYLWVKCSPEKIPVAIEIDVSELDIGDAVHIKDLDPGEGVVFLEDPNASVVSVVAPTVVKEEEAAEEAGEEAEAKPEAGAPEEKKEEEPDKKAPSE